jgi:hypothetical protein
MNRIAARSHGRRFFLPNDQSGKRFPVPNLRSVVDVKPFPATYRMRRATMTRLQTWLGSLCLMSCALASSAAAQRQREASGDVARGVSRAGVDSLKAVVGLRVRVKNAASSSWQTGTLASVNDENLMLRGHDNARISTQSLVAVQRSLGHARYNPTIVGFVFGLVAGGGAGFAIGNANRPSSQPNGSQRSVGLAIGAATGAALGAVIGAALAPEHWRDIRLR